MEKAMKIKEWVEWYNSHTPAQFGRINKNLAFDFRKSHKNLFKENDLFFVSKHWKLSMDWTPIEISKYKNYRKNEFFVNQLHIIKIRDLKDVEKLIQIKHEDLGWDKLEHDDEIQIPRAYWSLNFKGKIKNKLNGIELTKVMNVLVKTLNAGSKKNDYIIYPTIKKTYFNAETLLSDYSNLKLDFPKSKKIKVKDKEKIINFIKKYSFGFIPYKDSINYYYQFVIEWRFFQFLLKFISENKKYLYSSKKKLIDNHFDLQKIQAFLNRRLSKARKNPFLKSNEIPFIFLHWDYPIHYLYDYIIKKETKNWIRCLFCNNWFPQYRKNQFCCCPHHSKIIRDQRYRKKNKKIGNKNPR